MNLPRNKMIELILGADRSKWTVHSNHNIRCFTQSEIERVTNNYRTMIGKGGFGEVYIGVLEDKNMVAVKKFIGNVKENFAKELIVHSEINHKNVVRLIGYCIEGKDVMLVTEYIPNGNLSKVLHRDNIPIPLDIRLRVATECAEALAYMHSHMYTQVIHGDIKPANILLDGNFNAKLSDFGISRLVNTDNTLYTEHVMGSIGYMDPLFVRDGRLTVKSDVYSFGVVLVQLITRKRATTENGRISNNVNLFIEALARGSRSTRELFDAEIASQNNMKILEGVAKLASECLRLERDRRPQMIDVAERLRTLRKASHGGQKRVDFFSWVRKIKPAAEPIGSVWNMGILQDFHSDFTGTSSSSVAMGENSGMTDVTSPTETSPSDLCSSFSFEDIKAASKNFDESLLVGKGAFGRVYRGEIDGGATKVAIKRFHSQSVQICHGFRTEIEMILKLRHHNLVPLISYCEQEGEKILVYKYMVRGSLREHLLGTKRPPLTWKQRLVICIGAARGLHYLHQGSGHAIVHGNVKLTNILLDENWVAKITDVGLSTAGMPFNDTRTFHSDSYRLADPEFFRLGRLTEKSDVYSFGAVLFEVLCARPFVDYKLPLQQVYLLNWALRHKKEGKLDQVIDPYLKEKIDPRCFKRFSQTAEMCVAYWGIDRPSMGTVVSNLEDAFQLQVSAEVSGR
ncbi:hypothetical protein ACP70R_012274 [Stipagrostis hirtigluma subsp. patula]